MGDPIPADQVVEEPVKRKRGRPRKNGAVPAITFAQPEPQWPCRVRLVTAKGTEDFGCSRVSMQQGFFVFETFSNGVTQKRYQHADSVVLLQTAEAVWQAAPPSSGGYVVYNNGMNSGIGIQTTPSIPAPQAPQEYNVRSGLRTMMSPVGPVSEVQDANGPAVAGAGFMS